MSLLLSGDPFEDQTGQFFGFVPENRSRLLFIFSVNKNTSFKQEMVFF